MGLDTTRFPDQSEEVVPLATSIEELVRMVDDIFNRKRTRDFSVLSLDEQKLIILVIANYAHFFSPSDDEYATIRRLIFQYRIEKNYSGYSDELNSAISGGTYKQ